MLGCTLCAQEPTTHEVSFPSGDAAWTITFGEDRGGAATQRADSAKEKTVAGQVAKIEIVRMADGRHDIVNYANGSKAEIWWPARAGLVVFRMDGERANAFRSGYFDGQRYDAAAFQWVSRDTFLGMETFGGRSCRHYVFEQMLVGGEKIVFQAWIDNQTNRPVALKVGGGAAGVFAFDLPLPDRAYAPDSEFAAALERCREALVPRKSYGR
ncbi:hypothetical protein DB345_05870 [Spartobacteria bacterium LR76]|nr:hypothetical protein DB345_05870 [Spartobacteria bacterium LR76]